MKLAFSQDDVFAMYLTNVYKNNGHIIFVTSYNFFVNYFPEREKRKEYADNFSFTLHILAALSLAHGPAKIHRLVLKF